MQSPTLPPPRAQVRTAGAPWSESSAGTRTLLAALGIAALHHIGMALKTETGKQLFLIICWHLLSLELLRLIYKTGHLSLRLLLQSCFAFGRVHFSSSCATPQTGFTLQRTQQQCKYKPAECKATPAECCTSSCHTTTQRKRLCSQFKQKY